MMAWLKKKKSECWTKIEKLEIQHADTLQTHANAKLFRVYFHMQFMLAIVLPLLPLLP